MCRNFNEVFPQPQTQVGYCGAEFHSEPPKDALHGLTNRLQLLFMNVEESQPLFL